MGLISITSPSTSWDLITLDDLPSNLRSSTNDPHLSLLIERVSRAIPRYIGRILARQAYQEDVAGYGDFTLRIMDTLTSDGLYPGGPLSSVASVYYLDNENSTVGATQTTDWQIQNKMAGELYRPSGWDWTAQVKQELDARVAPGSERPLWRVAYTAGFTLPRVGVQSATQEGNLPFEIRQAAVDSVIAKYHQEQRDPTVARYRMGDVAIEYRIGGDVKARALGLTESAVELLEPWMRYGWE